MYDYVIVGAGSAGCVVANRLGEDPDVKVAVIEAGPPDDAPEIHMPLAFGPNLTSDWDWALFSEPEPGPGLPAQLPAARPRARRLELAQRDDLHPRQPRRLRRVGGAGPRGLGLRRRPAVLQARRGQRARRRAATTASAARSASATAARCIPWSRPGSRPRARPASRTTTTSTAPPRTAPGATSSPSATAGAAAPRSPTCTRRWRAATSTSSPTRASTGSSSRASARSACEYMRHGELEQVRAEREVILAAGSLPLAAAAHALRRRARRGSWRPLGIEAAPRAPGRPEPAGPRDAELRLPDRQGQPDLVGHARGVRAVRERGPRAGHLQRRRGRRLRPHPRRRSRRPTCSSTSAACSCTRSSSACPFDDAYTFGPAVVKPTSRGQVTLRSPLPARAPADRPQLPARPRRTAQSMIAGTRLNFEISAAPALQRVAAGRLPRAEVRLRGRHHGLRPAPRPHAVPPGRHVRDGLRGRRRAARPRPRGPARRRRLGHADDPARQHQRADDHGRREGLGHHPRAARRCRASDAARSGSPPEARSGPQADRDREQVPVGEARRLRAGWSGAPGPPSRCRRDSPGTWRRSATRCRAGRPSRRRGASCRAGSRRGSPCRRRRPSR